MTKSDPNDLDDLRLREAALWIARLESGDMTDTQQTEYQEWIGQTPENQDAIEQIRRTWLRTGIAREYFVDGAEANGESGQGQVNLLTRARAYLRQYLFGGRGKSI